MSKDDKNTTPIDQNPKVTRDKKKQKPKAVNTKKDPKVEISSWVDYQDQEKKTSKKTPKVSKSLENLQKVRKKRLGFRIGLTIVLVILVVGGAAYYFSPYSKIDSIEISGNQNISKNNILKTANLSTKDRIVGALLGSKTISDKLKKEYPSVKNVSVSLTSLTRLKLNISQYDGIGYLKTGNNYQIILHNFVVGKEVYKKNKLSDLPIYYGFKNNSVLKSVLKLIDKFPNNIKSQISGVSVAGLNNTQIALRMKNGNYIFGNRQTIVDKLKYYPKIAKQLSQPSFVDFEIGAFSRPIYEKDKKMFAD